jgi:hypothetical protein
MDFELAALLKRGKQKVRLSERLSARECDAAAGLVVKRGIPGDGSDQIGCADPP